MCWPSAAAAEALGLKWYASLDEVLAGEDAIDLLGLLELAAGEAETVDIHVGGVRILARHDVHVRLPAQLGVQVADLGVAEVEVEPEVFAEEAVAAPERLGIEVRGEFLVAESLEEEVHEGGVLLVQVPLDLGDDGVESAAVRVLEVRGQEGETGDDILVVTHALIRTEASSSQAADNRR